MIKSRPHCLTSLRFVYLLKAIAFLVASSQAGEVDLFVSGGQSNAKFNKFGFGVGIERAVKAASEFSNAELVMTARGATPLIKWMDDEGNPQECYHQHFFNHTGEGKPGLLEARIQEIKDRGDTVRFRGFFWFQGEAELKPEKGGSVEKYRERFDLLLNQLAKDIGHEGWNFVLNTVAKKKAEGASEGINDVLADIANTHSRGVLHNTQEGPQRTGGGVHSYDHILVGQNNVRLFIETFISENDEPE